MLRIDADDRQVGRDTRGPDAERLEELAFETEVQASLTRYEQPAVSPSVEAQLRALLGPGTGIADAAPPVTGR